MSPRTSLLALAAAVAPTGAWAAQLTTVGVFADAAPIPKLIMLGLLGASLAGVIVSAVKLASGPRLAGGSAFLSGLRAGGPLAGLLGAAYVALNLFIGLANAPATPPLQVIAPGLAEAVLLIGLGLLSGAVAAVGHWLVESRIDRAVLKS